MAEKQKERAAREKVAIGLEIEAFLSAAPSPPISTECYSELKCGFARCTGQFGPSVQPLSSENSYTNKECCDELSRRACEKSENSGGFSSRSEQKDFGDRKSFDYVFMLRD